MKNPITIIVSMEIILADADVKFNIDSGRTSPIDGIKDIENNKTDAPAIAPKITTISPNVIFLYSDFFIYETIPTSENINNERKIPTAIIPINNTL